MRSDCRSGMILKPRTSGVLPIVSVMSLYILGMGWRDESLTGHCLYIVSYYDISGNFYAQISNQKPKIGRPLRD